MIRITLTKEKLDRSFEAIFRTEEIPKKYTDNAGEITKYDGSDTAKELLLGRYLKDFLIFKTIKFEKQKAINQISIININL